MAFANAGIPVARKDVDAAALELGMGRSPGTRYTEVWIPPGLCGQVRIPRCAIKLLLRRYQRNKSAGDRRHTLEARPLGFCVCFEADWAVLQESDSQPDKAAAGKMVDAELMPTKSSEASTATNV
ncbi:MAG: hypothetical protein ACRD4S_03140 [Candidatus Acidiferrales bacterium]